MAKRNTSKFLAESKKNPESQQGLVPVSGAPSAATLALFTVQKADEIDEKKVVRRNMPKLLKPDQVPIWTPDNPVILQGKIVKFLPSPKSTIKGVLIWLELPTGQEITFPCTGVVRQALAPSVKRGANGEPPDSTELLKTLESEVGKTLFLKRMPDEASKEFGGKAMFVFDVYTSDK